MDNEAGCRALASQLQQGQRLVGRDGSMWRWDGYTIQAGSPTPEVQRLEQRNRLKDLTADMDGVAANLSRAHAEYDLAKAALSQASTDEQTKRQELQAAYNTARDARESLTRAEQALSQVNARLTGLLQSLTSLETDTNEAEQQLGATDDEIAGLPDLGEPRARIVELKPILTDQRGRLIECRSTDDRLRREAQQRQQRLDQIQREVASWTQRAEAAARHLDALAQRREAMEAEIARLAALPEQLAQQRNQLLSLLSNAEQARRDRADELQTAENALTEADRALKLEEHRLAEMRENKVRSESAVEQAREAEQSLTERIRERLECTPADVLPLAELDPSEPLPDKNMVDQKLQRLLRERENIGPVNLRAEVESNELDQQLAGMQTERSDLVNAIARLRQGINSLNREGRERLLAAFELVNGHFETLFTRLFGGGRAHLALTEAEDPLEAGLEILASPAGQEAAGDVAAVGRRAGADRPRPAVRGVPGQPGADLRAGRGRRTVGRRQRRALLQPGRRARPRRRHAVPGHHPPPPDHGPHGPPVRRHHVGTRRVSAGLGGSAGRARAEGGAVASIDSVGRPPLPAVQAGSPIAPAKCAVPDCWRAGRT